MKKTLFFGLVLSLFVVSCKEKNEFVWYSTSEDSAWVDQSSMVSIVNQKVDSLVSINLDQKQQKMMGFGGCFNELGWSAIELLSEDAKNEIMMSLFDATACNFNHCRLPIGANDYAVGWYSHNENIDDFLMEKFSIARDTLRLIPYINAAKKIQKDLILWASPWCPPSWLKSNNHYACSGDIFNGLDTLTNGKEMTTQFIMKPEYLKAYALYFAKFIQEYKKEGIDISAVHVQNEPNSCQVYPACIWNPKDMAIFIGNYLGPQFEQLGLQTEIWLGTIERPQIERVDTIMNYAPARKYIKGLGFQWGGKDAIEQCNEKYSEYPLMQTENECGSGTNDWNVAVYTYRNICSYLNKGACAYMYWNMVLEKQGNSFWGWKQNAMISIDTTTKEVKFNPEFYVMKHLSHFVKIGDHKLPTSDPSVLAFGNDTYVIVYFYNAGEAHKKQLEIKGKLYQLDVAKNSFNTLKIIL